MAQRIVTVFGGSGFVGRNLVRELAKAGWRVRAAVRRPHEAHFLRPMGDVGQIAPIQANVRNMASVRRAIAGSDAVVNLVGILYEGGAQTFDTVQLRGAENVATACAEAGITNLVQMSAIGADENSASDYARSKALGEQAARSRVPTAKVVRPSIVFGQEDQFFNRFAAMARISPALPLIGGGETRFQPVYVDDVADAIVALLEDRSTDGKTYELGGPKIYTFKALMQLMLDVTGRKRLLVPLPFWLASIQAWLAETAFWLVPIDPPLTRDQVTLLKTDNVVAPNALTLKDLGIAPKAAEAIVPSYLWRFRAKGQFEPPLREVGDTE